MNIIKYQRMLGMIKIYVWQYMPNNFLFVDKASDTMNINMGII